MLTSVLLGSLDVLTSVTTPLVATSVCVKKVMSWIVMASLAQVRLPHKVNNAMPVLPSPDLDECDLNVDNCQELCVNTEGSFECACSRGFSLDSDGVSCNGMFS